MPEQVPPTTTIAEAISSAARAPSFANTHPWRWQLTRRVLALYAVPGRVRGDGADRSMLISCGTTLHHLCVAMAAAGWEGTVERLPAGAGPGVLATVTFGPSDPTDHDRALAAAIQARHSYRTAMATWPVPVGHLDALVATARDHGALLLPLTDERSRAVWTGLASRLPPHPDGAGRAHTDATGASAATSAAAGVAGDAADGTDDAGVALLLSTSSDDPLAWLRAGEALSAVLLEATRIGMVTRLDSSVVDVDSARTDLEQRLLHGTSSPQILICVGWPGAAPATPPAPPARIA